MEGEHGLVWKQKASGNSDTCSFPLQEHYPVLTGKAESLPALDKGLKCTPVKYSENILITKCALQGENFPEPYPPRERVFAAQTLWPCFGGGQLETLGKLAPQYCYRTLPFYIVPLHQLQCSSGSAEITQSLWGELLKAAKDNNGDRNKDTQRNWRPRHLVGHFKKCVRNELKWKAYFGAKFKSVWSFFHNMHFHELFEDYSYT